MDTERSSITVRRLSPRLGALFAAVALSTGTLMAQTPVIGSVATANAKVATPFSYQISASNLPTAYGAASLPTGLAVNSKTGLISGTVTSIDGIYNATISASNASGMGVKAIAITVAPTLPVITSAASLSGKEGSALSYQITGSNYPRTYGATGLPAGLTINATSGVISGVPSAAGNFNVTISVTNGAGTATKTLSLGIIPLPPVISSAVTATAKVGSSLNYQITATKNPTAYSAVNLPAGLSVNAKTGLFGGTVTSIDGIYNATISASNAGGTGVKALVITVAPTLPVITSSARLPGKEGSALSYKITASNYPRTYGATGLPAGLTINATSGVISGVPVAAGNVTVTISATNGAGTTSKTLALGIIPLPPVISSVATASAKVGSSFSYQITATKNPTAYGAVNLPAGLRVNSQTGLISGTVTSIDGISNATISASNAGGTGAKTLAITVAPTVPVITSAASLSGKEGSALIYQTIGSSYPRIYSATGLPAGLTINATSGVIRGVPAAAGNFTVTISATNGAGTVSKTLALGIIPLPPVISSVATATAKVGSSFSYQITATKNPTAYSATSLPAGLAVNSQTGLISGTVTSIDGISNATISASNAGGTGVKTLAITVAPTLPVVSSPTSATGRQGISFSYKITGTNYPRTYGATGLPGGLTLNATSGVISGVPTAAGNATVTISASNGAGASNSTLTLGIVTLKPVINLTSIASGILRAAHPGHVFTASGGAGGNVWSLIDGYLPPGMTLNATTGALAGTPTNAGAFTFVVGVRDSTGLKDELEVVLEVESSLASFTVGDVLSAIPGGGATQSAGNATCSFDYNPSGSSWIAGVSEEAVFFASMNSSSGWRLGIGKGGQVYSLRGSFGEAIPPQRVDAPWVDEAWQFVATSLDLVSPVHAFQSAGSAQRLLGFPIQFFIHQSGIYRGSLAGNSLVGSPSIQFYSPILKKHWNPATRTLSLVSWSQMARSPNVWKSGMLTYASYRDLGNGAIEVTNFVTNFGDQDLTFINTPWGGARPSTFPETVLSQRGGAWRIAAQGPYGSNTPIFARDTGGWQAWVQKSTQEQSDSLAVVFGNQPLPSVSDQAWKSFWTILTYGLTHVGRDYAVSSIQNNIRLQAGQSLACRWHLVLGPFGQTRSKASALAPHAGDRRLCRQPSLDNGRNPLQHWNGEPGFLSLRAAYSRNGSGFCDGRHAHG
jgi:hypothetical protein